MASRSTSKHLRIFSKVLWTLDKIGRNTSGTCTPSLSVYSEPDDETDKSRLMTTFLYLKHYPSQLPIIIRLSLSFTRQELSIFSERNLRSLLICDRLNQLRFNRL